IGATQSWKYLNLEETSVGSEVSSLNLTGLTAIFQFDISRSNHCLKSIGSSGIIHNELFLRIIWNSRVVATAQRAGPYKYQALGNCTSAGRNGLDQTRSSFNF